MSEESVSFVIGELTEDENELYDRQIRLWGLESQKRLRTAKILVSGLDGMGAEITKNLILSGVHSVKLQDDAQVMEEDLSSQFLLLSGSLGTNRALASIERARKLNPMVEISADTEPLEKKMTSFFIQFDAVVIIGAEESQLIRINKVCRKHNIYFFCGDVWGMFGYCCADLQQHSFIETIIRHNKKEETKSTTIATTKRELIYPSIEEILNFNIFTEENSKALKRTRLSFILLHVLQKFRSIFNRDPSCKFYNEDMLRLQNICNELNNEDIIPISVFANVFSQTSASSAIVGGVLTQELLKVISKKDAPLYNIFIFDPEYCFGFIENTAKFYLKK